MIEEIDFTFSIASRTEDDRRDGCRSQRRVVVAHGWIIGDDRLNPVFKMSVGGVFDFATGDGLWLKFTISCDLRTLRDVVKPLEAFSVTEDKRTKMPTNELFDGRVLTSHGSGDESLHTFGKVGDNGRDIRDIPPVVLKENTSRTTHP